MPGSNESIRIVHKVLPRTTRHLPRHQVSDGVGHCEASAVSTDQSHGKHRQDNTSAASLVTRPTTSDGFQPFNSDGLQPTGDGLQPARGGLPLIAFRFECLTPFQHTITAGTPDFQHVRHCHK